LTTKNRGIQGEMGGISVSYVTESNIDIEFKRCVTEKVKY